MSIRDAELADLMRVVRGVSQEKGVLFVKNDYDVRRAKERCRKVGCTEHEMELVIEAALEPSH